MTTSANPINTWIVKVDWNDNGTFDVGEDISAYVQDVEVEIGQTDPLSLVANAGKCTVTLNNSDKRFSPGNTSGPYYGQLVQDLLVQVQATNGVTTWTLFYGLTRRFLADSGIYGTKHAEMDCVDLITILQDQNISLPLQQSIVSGTLIKHVINAALQAPIASGSITSISNVAVNDTVTLNGQVYKFVASLAGAANEVLIGGRRDDTAINLIAAINNDVGVGTVYGTNTPRNAYMTATYTPDLALHAAMFHDESLVIAGNALAITIDAAARMSYYAQQNPSALNNSFTQSFWAQAGNFYFLQIRAHQTANAGSGDWYVDGVLVFTQDLYAAAPAYNTFTSAQFTILTSGRHQLKCIISTKSGSSTGYDYGLTTILIKPATDT